MRGKINAGGGSSGNLNVYTQLTEPSKKKGIWIQCDSEYEGVETTSIVKQGYYPINFGNFSSLWFYDAGQLIKEDAYLFAGPSTGTYTVKTLYSYSILLDVYTKKTGSPVDIQNKGLANVGTDMYIFGADVKVGSNYEDIGIYKYSTLENTYTKLTNAPIGVSYTTAIGIGTDIYIFGANTSSKETYKYDTLTGEFTQLKTMPGSHTVNADVVGVIGDDIYLFGAGNDNNSYKTNYKYNILTDTFTTLKSSTLSQQIVVMVGEYIYLFFTDTTYAHRIYQYNPVDNIFTQLSNIAFMLNISTERNIRRN